MPPNYGSISITSGHVNIILFYCLMLLIKDNREGEWI